MFLQGLKISISVHLLTLIILGMILVNLAITTTFQKIFINREIKNGELLISSLQLQVDGYAKPERPMAAFLPAITDLLDRSDYTCVLVLDENFQHIYANEAAATLVPLFTPSVRKAISSKEKDIQFVGETRGVFWKAEENLLISFPLVRNNAVIGGVGVSYDLSEFYQALRDMQQLLWLFMAISAMILTFIGFYRLSKIAVNPIYRLLRRVEDFETDDGFFFQHGNKSNAFNRLSFSLNQMLMRIRQDKQTLQSTIASLEKSNNRLKQAQKEIIKSEKLAAVGRFSAGVAHEIGNPIGIILGYIDLLKKEKLSGDEKQEYLFRAEKETRRVKNIIRQLLNYTRSTTTDFKTISVHGLLKDLVKMVSPQPLMQGIDVSLNLNASMDQVLGHPDLVHQVFLNLLINAADAVCANPDQSSGRIWISTENGTGHQGENPVNDIIIEFMDNGIGISDLVQEALFDPFFTTKDPGKGVGLGLYVSFMIIENMGGGIELISGQKNSTVMAVRLHTIHKKLWVDEPAHPRCKT